MTVELSSTFVPNTKGMEFKLPTSGEWLDFEEPLIISTIGMRGGGKTGISDYMMQKYYDKYFTVLHLFSARSLENLYPIVNKNCGHHFEKIKQLLKNKCYKNDTDRPCRLRPNEEEFYIKQAERGEFIKKKEDDSIILTEKGFKLLSNKLLHCKCSKALPVLLLVPDYIDFKQETLDRFNGWIWKDMDEYKQHLSEISTEERILLQEGKLLKPSYLRPKPLIKVNQFTVPTTAVRIEKFRVEWTDSVLQAREEHRILVMSPLFFEGMDKFDTIQQIAVYHSTLMNQSGRFEMLTEKQVGKPYKYWSLKQKNHHKVAIFIDEARSVVPSSKLHGETGAGKSKKALFDKVPEMRHYKTWLFFFYQNPMDVYDGIRSQDNMTIMKRTHLQLAGAEWQWIFKKVEGDRFGFARKMTRGRCESMEQLKFYENRYPVLKQWLDERRPRLEVMTSDQAYVVRYGKIRLIKNSMGTWHHKQEMESIKGDTGIDWTINREKRPDEISPTKKEGKLATQNKEKTKEIIFKRMKYAREVEKKDYIAVGKDLVEMQNDHIIPDMGFEGKDADYFGNLYNRWKKKYESVSV